MSVEIRRAASRYADKGPGRVTHHAFSFGPHYDPERLGFGAMVCHDDHLLGSGRGFETHRHADLEIVTWVVAGALTHRNGAEAAGSDGAEHVVGAGSVAVLSAGSGVEHSEVATDAGPARFVQVWLTPDDTARPPSYDVATPALGAGGATGLVPVAGADAELSLGVAGAALAVARLGAGEELVLPAAPRVHVFVATGALVRSSMAEPLVTGDAFLMTDEPGHTVVASVPTELLVWTLP